MISRAATVLGWVLLVPGVLGSAALLVLQQFIVLHTWHHYLIAAASFVPLLWIPVLVTCLGLVLVLRAKWRLIGAVLLVAATGFFAWPLFPGAVKTDTPVIQENTLTALSLNLQYGRADIEEVSELITSEVDVLALQEYTPGFAQELAAAGLLEQFPHRVGTSAEDASGSMLLSRTPVELVARTEGTRFENLIATITVDGTLWHVGVIHTAPPQMGAGAWSEDAAAVGDLAAPFLGENLLLVGDFNAIPQHHTMRELTADGALRDLADREPSAGGSHWHPTWPTGTWMPPFARIDHALVSEGVGGSAPSFVAVSGTDHKALLVEVAARTT